MKTTVRNRKFTLGIILFLLIILVLCVSSAFYLNKLSDKTNAILTQNHYSVIYAQDMTSSLTSINHEVVTTFLTGKIPDKTLTGREFDKIDKALSAEENNITEAGEQSLVSEIKESYAVFRQSVAEYSGGKEETNRIQQEFTALYGRLISLAEINEKAIENKTYDAKDTAKKSLVDMSLIGAFCFLIAYGFTFSFSSYFNERFHKLCEDIKEIHADNYNGRLFFKGGDEIYDISVIFNSMADQITNNQERMEQALPDNAENYLIGKASLNKVLQDIRTLENEVTRLLKQADNR